MHPWTLKTCCNHRSRASTTCYPLHSRSRCTSRKTSVMSCCTSWKKWHILWWKKLIVNTFARGMLHASTKSSMKRSGIAQDSIQSKLNIQLPIYQIFFRVLPLCCIDNFVTYRLILQFVFIVCLRFSMNFKFLALCKCFCSSEFWKPNTVKCQFPESPKTLSPKQKVPLEVTSDYFP